EEGEVDTRRNGKMALFSGDSQAPAGITHVCIIKRGDLDGGNVQVIPASSFEEALAELHLHAMECGPPAESIGEQATIEDVQAVFSEGHEEDGWEVAILPLHPSLLAPEP